MVVHGALSDVVAGDDVSCDDADAAVGDGDGVDFVGENNDAS